MQAAPRRASRDSARVVTSLGDWECEKAVFVPLPDDLATCP